MLVLENVTKSFGGLRAVSEVGFSVPDRAVFGLIGPNGAGKTTVFNLITGVYRADRGAIRFGERDLGALRPAAIARAGIGRTFQNIRLFGQLSVLENLLVAGESQDSARRHPLTAAIFRLRSHYADERSMTERARELLRVFGLEAMADERPTALSYGNQRRLEIARAMMARPKVLLLDEPAAGMNYGEAEGLKTQIRWLRDTFELSIVLVEHNMQVVMGVCEEIHVLDHGETIAHGTPDAIRTHPKVLAAYLGEVEESAASVREVAAELSRPDLGAPSSSQRILPPAPGSARLLSEREAADLSFELTRDLERGLSRVDPGELTPLMTPALVIDHTPMPPPPATPTPTTPLPDSSRPTAPPPGTSDARLHNVDSGWSSDHTPVATPFPTSVPDVAALDQGWASERNLTPPVAPVSPTEQMEQVDQVAPVERKDEGER